MRQMSANVSEVYVLARYGVDRALGRREGYADEAQVRTVDDSGLNTTHIVLSQLLLHRHLYVCLSLELSCSNRVYKVCQRRCLP